MRIFFQLAPLACFLVHLTAVAQSATEADVDARREEATIAQLRSLVGSVPTDTPSWSTAEVRDPLSGNLVTVYRSDEVTQSLDVVKAKYLNAVKDIPALAEYVDEVFTLPAGTGFGGAGIVRKDVVDRRWSALRSLSARLGTLGELTVTLAIRTTPVQGGSFHMESVGRTQRHSSETDGTIDPIWRGLYEYVIEKHGYKKIVGTIDLVQQSSGILTCTLINENAPGRALPCRYEVAK